jgi:S-DNA-T family DNA segregation ATPase FtsK/SpoIIIE
LGRCYNSAVRDNLSKINWKNVLNIIFKRLVIMPRKIPEKPSALQTEVKYLVMAAVGILLLLVVFLQGESPGWVVRFFSDFLFGLFGWGTFFLPVGILAFSVCSLVARNLRLPVFKIIAVYWIFISFLHIWIYRGQTDVSPVDVYVAGRESSGGGIMGWILGGLLRTLTNDIIAGFILVAAAIILLVLITKKSFVNIVGMGWKKARTYYEESREEAFDDEEDAPTVPLLREKKATKKSNIVEISPEESETPEKIHLISEELDGKEKEKRASNPLFSSREAPAPEPKRGGAITFPDKINPIEQAQDFFPEDEFDNEHVILPVDYQAHADDDYAGPVVKGLVEGGEQGDMYADDEDDMLEYDEFAIASGKQNATPDYENFQLPSLNLLAKAERTAISAESRTHVLENSRILEETLRSFRIEAKVVEVSVGPTVTRYDLSPGPGVKVSSISNLNNDLALSLAAQGLRIEAPVPGKSAIGIEIPNKEPQGVFLREILEDERFINYPSKLAFAVGKDIAGSPIITDVARMPHLLIAGATGSGKSVCINTLITSLLYKARPDEVKLLMIDPKVVELSVYNGIPHLLIPVVTDPKKASGALSWAVAEMEKRYNMFAETGVRDLKGYNKSAADYGEDELPQIVIIIDELADLMMTCKGEVEESICRLAQKARAAGIHLIVATQRPSVDVITGLIKANIPSRLAFAVSSGTDSRTVLDMYGAEKLLGKGDMLFLPMGQNKPLRVQGGFISDKEVENLVAFLKAQAPVEHSVEEIQRVTMPGKAVIEGEVDEFFHDAVDFLITKGKGSTSMLQRQFRIGYNRASRLMDDLEARGIVGPEDGVKPRKVTITREEYRELYG